MAGFNCPFCKHDMSLSSDTFKERRVSFEASDLPSLLDSTSSDIWVLFYKCPNCGEVCIRIKGSSLKIRDIDTWIRPNSSAIQYPNYIPITIKHDYEEACAIVSLSPKASATLSRRCLQSMIRDFWGIKKNRLVDEIDSLKGKVRSSQWKVIDALRELGNIGAHPDVDINSILDIEPQDAEKLLRVIESLIDKWYVARHDEEELFASVTKTAASKKSAKTKV